MKKHDVFGSVTIAKSKCNTQKGIGSVKSYSKTGDAFRVTNVIRVFCHGIYEKNT